MILIPGLIVSTTYATASWYSPLFLLALIFSAVLAVLVFISFYGAPLNRIYIDITKGEDGTNRANLSSSGSHAAAVMEAISETFANEIHGNASTGNRDLASLENSRPH